MDTRDESKFIISNNSNNNNNNIRNKNKQQQQEPIQHHGEGNPEMDHHLMVSGLYDDDETHTRKSSISFDKIKQISLTYSLQSEDDSQGTSNDVYEQHCRGEDESGAAFNTMTNDDRRDSSGSNHFCLSQADGDASDTTSSRKLSVIELKTIKQQQGNRESLFSIPQQQQQDTTNNDLDDAKKGSEENINSFKSNEQANNFNVGDKYYERNKINNNSLCKGEDEFYARNTVPPYLKCNPFVFDQFEYSTINDNDNNVDQANNRDFVRVNSNIAGTNSNNGSNNIDKLIAIGSTNEQNSIMGSEQLSTTRRVVEGNRGGTVGNYEIYSKPQYYGDVAEDIRIGKVMSRQTRHHRQQQQHQSHGQSAFSRRALSESAGLRQRGSERDALVVGDDAALIMGNEIGTSANMVGVDCSPRRKQLPHNTKSNSPAAVLALNNQQQRQQQQLPTPATGGYPQRDHHVSRGTMTVHRPVQQYGQLPQPSMQQLNSMLRAAEHSRLSSQDRIVAGTSRSSTGPGSERSSTTNGSSTGLKLKQHNNSISLVLFNKTDANIIISDEPSESCSEESCWGSSLPPNSSIGGLNRNTGIDNSLALGRQGGANDDDAGVEGNDYLSEEDLVNCGSSNEMFHHDASSNRDKNTSLSGRVSAGGFIGGVELNSRLTTASMMTPARVLNQRLDSMARNNQNHHHNQHQMFNVEKFVERPISQSSRTSHHTDTRREGHDLDTNMSVNHPDNHEGLIFENQRQQQQHQQQSSSSLSSTINETSLNNSYRHQLPGANQVRINNSGYGEDNQAQFFGNSSSSQSPLGIDMQPMSTIGRSKDDFNLISSTMNTNSGRNLNGSCDQLKRNSENRDIKMLNDVGEHSLVRDEIIMKKNIHGAQANTQAGYVFDEDINEHFGLVRQSPIIIDRVDANPHRTNKIQLRGINNTQQQYKNKHLQYTNHSNNQARGSSRAPISFYNNMINRRHLSSSQADQIDHSSLYEFDEEDDDYVYNTNSVYASPIHLSRRLHANELPAKTYRDDSRRVNIVISSPQRYIRPPQTRRMRATGQQFWSDPPSKSAPQDYLYFNGGRNFPTNGGGGGSVSGGIDRRPISEVEIRGNRLTQMDYRLSSPSPIGSQSGWSSYGSINRDNIIVGSQTGPNTFDESTQQKLAQLQYQQQKNAKQQHAQTNYYQADEFSPKSSNEMNQSSTYFNGDNINEEIILDDTVLTNKRRPSNICRDSGKQDCSNSAGSTQQQQLIDQSCLVHKTDLNGSNVVSSEKDSSRIKGDKTETEVSNKSVQQSGTKQQQQNLSVTANISNKSSAIGANK